MKIKKVTEGYIEFDNAKRITFDHCQECCECNYADFSVLSPNTVNIHHDFEEPLTFKLIEGIGFSFGNPGHMIFIPCYSDQNGYYTNEVDIYFDDERVLTVEAENGAYI